MGTCICKEAINPDFKELDLRNQELASSLKDSDIQIKLSII